MLKAIQTTNHTKENFQVKYCRFSPHNLKTAYAKNHGSFRSTPFGNSLTIDFAKTILDGYQLGQGAATDFLTINCASTDYVGHLFGPNSVEVEDTYLRLDLDLASFFSYLDQKIGKGQYIVFLTADHGASHAVGYSQANRMPADFFVSSNILTSLDQLIQQKLGYIKVIRSAGNYQINFDMEKIAAYNADFDAIKKLVVEYLKKTTRSCLCRGHRKNPGGADSGINKIHDH